MKKATLREKEVKVVREQGVTLELTTEEALAIYSICRAIDLNESNIKDLLSPVYHALAGIFPHTLTGHTVSGTSHNTIIVNKRYV